MIKDYKIIKYKITGPFADLEEGLIINALLLTQGDNGVGLIFHPKCPDECPSIEFARKIGKSDVWRSVREEDDFGYINLEVAFQKAILGKSFKWKRKFWKNGEWVDDETSFD